MRLGWGGCRSGDRWEQLTLRQQHCIAQLSTIMLSAEDLFSRKSNNMLGKCVVLRAVWAEVTAGVLRLGCECISTRED